MATVTFMTIQKKIVNIIKTKPNFPKNVKNYLDYMNKQCLISDSNLQLGKDNRLHITIRLFNKKLYNHTFNVTKIQMENHIDYH